MTDGTGRMPYFKIDWTEDDVQAVSSVIRRGSFWAEGPEISVFEEKLASFQGREHALAVSNGTAAQHLAMQAVLPRGSKVIVPSFTFISTVNTVEHAGCIPVFAEIEDETFGLDAEDVAERIDSGTGAIVIVHFAGQVARDIRAISELAYDHGIVLIEDTAEAMGARSGGELAGSFGDLAFLSFCQNKVITTGEGGAVVTDNEEWVNRIKVLRSHGRSDPSGQYFTGDGRFTYTEPGYNMRMPTMCAALGISQLSRINDLIRKRREAAGRYSDRFCDVDGIEAPQVESDPFHIFQMYSVMLGDGTTRDLVKGHLNSKLIPSKVNFLPVHLEEHYRRTYGHSEGDLRRTEEISKRVLTLPFHPNMTSDEIERVSSAVIELL